MENQKKLNGTNKLIAEFMDWEKSDNSYNNVEIYNRKKIYGNWRGASFMKFHKSWDWLMPVIDKIESFTDDLNQCRYNVEIEQCFVCIIDNHNSEDIIKLDADKKIDAVYQAVVEFIKFYNKNT